MNQPSTTETKTADDRPAPAQSRTLPCPYCGSANAAASISCDDCGGIFEPLSRQATQNAMGPWFVRDPENPFSPGCSFETLRKLIKRGRVAETTVLRGPTTNQFWMHARRTPGVAVLFGLCHGCENRVNPEDFACEKCGSALSPATSRESLGLAPLTPIRNQGTMAGNGVGDSQTLEGFVPVTSPGDVRNAQPVENTLGRFVGSASPAPRQARPDAPPRMEPAKASPQKQTIPAPTGDPQNATSRRLRKQLQGARTTNIVLLIVAGVLLTGLIVVLAGPKASPSMAEPGTSTPAGVADGSPVAADEAEVAPSNTKEQAIEEAQRIAEPGTARAIEDAIAVLRAHPSSEELSEEIRTLASRLDAIRLRESLTGS